MVAAAVLTALAIVLAVLVVREYMRPYPGSEVLLGVPTIPVALFAAGAMLVRHQMVRLFLVAGAVGAMAVSGFFAAQVSIGFLYNAAYVVPAALGWMTLIVMVAGFVAAWRESGFALEWALLAAAGGGVAGMCIAGVILWVFIVISLLMRPLTL